MCVRERVQGQASLPVSDASQSRDLWKLVKGLTFRSSVDALFGPRFLKELGGGGLQDTFWRFEQGFEMAASPLPHVLQPTFRHARASLLEAFRCGAPAGGMPGERRSEEGGGEERTQQPAVWEKEGDPESARSARPQPRSWLRQRGLFLAERDPPTRLPQGGPG